MSLGLPCPDSASVPVTAGAAGVVSVFSAGVDSADSMGSRMRAVLPFTLPGAVPRSGRAPRDVRGPLSGARAPHGSCRLARRFRAVGPGHGESLLVDAPA
ncbi:hypothetical protein GCM10023079_51560 [Streptomyces chitinivorans]